MPQEMRLKHRIAFNEMVKAEEPAESGRRALVGHTIVVDQKADGFWFTEEIAREAVQKALQRPLAEIRALWNHRSDFPLAKFGPNLELKEDGIGLWSRIKPTDTQYARDLEENVAAEIVNKMSFGFYILDEVILPANKERELPHFIVKDLELLEVSPVTFPFYAQTDLGVEKSMRDSEQFFERRMAAHGCSVNRARLVAQREILRAQLRHKLIRAKYLSQVA